MLERLEVRNYVLISSLIMEMGKGFSVITGETGSGKSILLGALGLILGEKAKSDIIREGEKEAVVNALFSYQKNTAVENFLVERELDDEEGELSIQRIVRSSGRSICSINGINVTREVLEELGSLLVDVSSQHAHQSLLKAEGQRRVLDAYSLPVDDKKKYISAYQNMKAMETKLEKLKAEQEKREGEIDYISYCLKEIEKANITLGEDEAISEELKRIEASEYLSNEVSEAQSALRGDMERGAISELDSAVTALEKASKKDSSLDNLSSRLESAKIEIEDISDSLRDYLSSLTFSEGELEEKSSRLALLQRLKKKYGPSLENVIEKGEKFRSELDAYDSFEGETALCEKKLSELKKLLDMEADNIHSKREKGARRLEVEVLKNLSLLGMENASFHISVERGKLSLNGPDDITFLIAANKGEKVGSLALVASGGELSRVMLALKCALTVSDEVDTLLFDEVDAGIGGQVASCVAERLEALGKDHQVLAITHLAQIASKACDHFAVTKSVDNERTYSHITRLGKDERVKEIARLLSGDSEKISLEHAKRMLNK
ncbi:MAG: DNA repair protein RecN [Sphaerochaetaceae bacterium]|nr:DNA repair protein RecN [Sphaerochaetaceae bacterium]